jgi:choline kinase
VIDQAVILAAGKGTRLRQSEDDLPKPLQVVGGQPLIERTIASLAAAGVKRVIVVTGFRAELVEAAIASRHGSRREVEVLCERNPDFEKSNGISVMIGGARANGPFMLSMADHIYTPAIARLVGTQDMSAADLYLATDPRIHDVLDIDDATKVRSDAGRIVEIGKQLTAYDRIDCGVFCVNPALLDALAEARRSSVKDDCSLTEGVRVLAARERARVADIGGERWQDVDTPADRAAAEAMLAKP